MNNFIKKLSNKEVGFIYLFLYIAIGYIYNITPFVARLNFLFTLTPIIMIIRVWLLISGLIKIFSKKSINNQQDTNIVIKTKLIESIVWIVLGILGIVSFFLFMFFCELFLKQKEMCGILGIYGTVLLTPVTIAGVTFIIIGFFKLNKYFKYRKIKKKDISEEVK